MFMMFYSLGIGHEGSNKVHTPIYVHFSKGHGDQPWDFLRQPGNKIGGVKFQLPMDPQTSAYLVVHHLILGMSHVQICLNEYLTVLMSFWICQV